MSIPCSYCGNALTLTTSLNDVRNPDQRVFRCSRCRLIEIHPPEETRGVGARRAR